MPIKEELSNSFLPHQLFHGTTWHSRLLPNVHKFVYPYRYWGVNISALAAGQTIPEVSTAVFGQHKFLGKLPLFSAKQKALQRFCPDDYLQSFASATDNKKIANDLSLNQALHDRLSQAFAKHTGSTPIGDMLGLLVCRNAGMYFSPVNFYIGFDKQQTPTHLLAEVSNTPWNKRHYYGFLLNGTDTEFCHDKNFHVSPFNPIDQLYRWQVTINNTINKASKTTPQNETKGQPDSCLQVRIAIDISDRRDDVLKTGIKVSGVPMTDASVRDSLQKNPLMNLTSLTRIYWHAFKLYAIKKVPYINYDEKLADSQQQPKSTQEDRL